MLDGATLDGQPNEADGLAPKDLGRPLGSSSSLDSLNSSEANTPLEAPNELLADVPKRVPSLRSISSPQNPSHPMFARHIVWYRLAIGPETWGPDPSTKIPIFYTTLADECAESVTKTASATVVTTPTPTIAARADANMTTTTLRDKVTFTGLVCISTGLAECPASLQSTTKVTSTRTLVTTVPSGSKATFPDNDANRNFGDDSVCEKRQDC
ncbi:hypothetical protein NUW58_g10723 [Xylaria curta]|uniref:Uncharacterized protein n=1 Tax=Xylaria curta TaxID=42375 RepID=A0ACC1MIL8_9PEZI|nr:hypothetical protein NUW58_g10723 [Xylaria curta]